MKTCMGVDVLDQQTMQMVRFVAPVTLLATGGAGQVCASHSAPTSVKEAVLF